MASVPQVPHTGPWHKVRTYLTIGLRGDLSGCFSSVQVNPGLDWDQPALVSSLSDHLVPMSTFAASVQRDIWTVTSRFVSLEPRIRSPGTLQLWVFSVAPLGPLIFPFVVRNSRKNFGIVVSGSL